MQFRMGYEFLLPLKLHLSDNGVLFSNKIKGNKL